MCLTDKTESCQKMCIAKYKKMQRLIWLEFPLLHTQSMETRTVLQTDTVEWDSSD